MKYTGSWIDFLIAKEMFSLSHMSIENERAVEQDSRCQNRVLSDIDFSWQWLPPQLENSIGEIGSNGLAIP